MKLIKIISSNLLIQMESMIDWLFGFYGISTFEGYLTPNPFLWK